MLPGGNAPREEIMHVQKLAGIAGVCALLAWGPAGAQPAPTVPQPTPPAAAPALAPGYGAPISLEMAGRAVNAAVLESVRRNLQMAVVVVDPSGTLVAFARVDGTQVASIQIAIDKARSAAMFRRSTKVFEDALVGGRMAILALTGAMPVEGGVPIVVGNQIVGAIGVSGGTAQEDGQIAAAGIAATR
jgi:uncharacterized protein GlcG (DUF336 family)